MMVLIALVAAAGGTVGLFDARLHVAGHTFGQFNEVGLLALMLLFGFLATRVSLPWYYVAWFLVPIAGAYAFWKISWRVAYLPAARLGPAAWRGARPVRRRARSLSHSRTHGARPA